MKIWDITSISFEGLSDKKYRFALNIIGILIGCAAITGLVSLTQGMNTQIASQLDILGADTVMIIPAENAKSLERLDATQIMNSIDKLNWRDVKLVQQIQGITHVAGFSSNYASYTIRGETNKIGIIGVSETFFEMNNALELFDGRYFTRSDNGVVLVGNNLAFPPSEDKQIIEVGDRVKIRTLGVAEEKEITLRVIGISAENGGIFGINPDDLMIIPLRTVEQLFDTGGEYSALQASVENMDEMDDIVGKIESRLGDDVNVVTTDSAKDLINDVTKTIESVLGGVAVISLIVAGVGIVNTMTVSVSERTQEIGTMKAIGATNRDVLLLFQFEAMYTGLLGGILGSFLGYMLAKMIGNWVKLPISFNPVLVIGVVFFAVVTSFLAGTGPAWNAAKLSPVEALRYG